MLDKIDVLKKEIQELEIQTLDKLEEYRINYLSKKGHITKLFSEFKNVPVELKKEFGQKINLLKQFSLDKYQEIKEELENKEDNYSKQDLTLPSTSYKLGNRHPINIVRNEIVSIFSKLGFTVSEGPEMEDDWHVFSALNFPLEHPARDMQDTFFIERAPDILLRTHTSSVQVREMEHLKPPIRTVTPGRVFRNEAISARAHCIFHQVEALYIDENVSFADLRQTLIFFAKEMFGEETKIRLRPSFFPFTEPSAEMDISCTLCGGKGCNVCKHTGWLEILGCGMVDPNVMKSTGIDNEKYTGFALGMGIERIAMLKFGVKDIRLFFENDIRFLDQFKSSL